MPEITKRAKEHESNQILIYFLMAATQARGFRCGSFRIKTRSSRSGDGSVGVVRVQPLEGVAVKLAETSLLFKQRLHSLQDQWTL